jgi:SAM-dependent methyltransferase
MDDPAVDAQLHRAALDKLAQFNVLAGSVGAIATELARLEGPLRVLDLATGAGDLPCGLMRRAQREQRAWQVDGADISPTSVEHARRRAARQARGKGPRFMVLDALRDPLPTDYDVLTCSLFLHHLSVDDAVALLSRMRAAAKRAVIVQDLLRSRAALNLTWLVTRLSSRNRLILNDGPLSVAAAFTLDEVAQLAQRAGLVAARIRARRPYRFVCTSIHGVA